MDAQQSLLRAYCRVCMVWVENVMERALYLQNPRLLLCKKEMKRERGVIPCQIMSINKKSRLKRERRAR